MSLRLAQYVLEHWTPFLIPGSVAAALCLIFAIFHRIRVRRLELRQFDLRVLVEQKSFSEGRYRELFENATDAVFITDLNGVITELNRKAKTLIGYDEALSNAVNLRDLLPETEAGDRILQQWLIGQADATEQTEITSSSGERVPVEVSTRVIEEAGSPYAVQAIVRDVRERTALERQLRQSQKMEAVGQLAGGVAHDFNNLLTVIRGNGALVLDELRDDDPLREDVQQINQAADRASVLTRQLLAFSRQQVVRPHELDLNGLLHGMQSMMQRIIGEDYVIRSNCSEEPAQMVADPGQIEQVLLNLVVNARDAMTDGGTIVIETRLVEAPRDMAGSGRAVCLTVTDTGIGMSAETQARIFEPFFTTKEVGKGTGLGLSTVFGIVQQSGGQIECISEPGAGTSFRIYWPYIASRDGGTSDTIARIEMKRGTETILLVEDDDAVRSLTSRVLRRAGYYLLEARSGQEALAIAQSYQYHIDLLLSDVVMPGMNGVVLSRRLSMARPTTRLLLISGYTDDEILRRGLHENHIAYLQKPFTPDSLTAQVRATLDATPAERSPQIA